MHSPVARTCHQVPSGNPPCLRHKLKGTWPGSHQGDGASEMEQRAAPQGSLGTGVHGDGEAAGTLALVVRWMYGPTILKHS